MSKTAKKGLALLIALVMCICLLPATLIAADEVGTENKADFDSIVLPANKATGDSSYTGTYTTANGWTTINSAIQCGGKTVLNPQFPVIGEDTTSKAVCMNGKAGACGKITSPTLTGGISKLTINYTKMFSDTKLGALITITDLTTGTAYTNNLSKEAESGDKYSVWTYEWTLETPITGDFTIEVLNTNPSQNTSGNKDRLTILDLFWEAPAAAPQETTATYTMVDYKVDGQLGGGEATRNLDDVLTFTISSGWFTTEARIYKNANGVLTSTQPISTLVINVGNKNSTFDVYTSEDGETWTMYQEDVAFTTSYTDITLTFETPVKHIKLDSPNAQLRIKTITATFLASGSVTPSEPVTPPTEEPTTEPTVEPTTEPTVEPTVEPTTEATEAPTTAPSTGLTLVTNPVPGTAYKLALTQGNLNKELYFIGETTNQAYYMKSSENAADAIDVFLEEVTGGMRLYFMKDGVKTYIDMYKSGNYYNLRLTTSPTAVYTWNTEYNTLVATVAGTDCYIGTYNSFNTFSCSKLSMISTSFPSHLYSTASEPSVPPTEEPTVEPTTEPTVEPTTEATTEATTPVAPALTGDASVIVSSVAVLALSAIGGTALIIKKKEN